ncbi:MAG TPA: aquaporin [Nitrososphaeraceae archaeon]|nr:aquaporin [Nitrososphaeraceae archaeon]
MKVLQSSYYYLYTEVFVLFPYPINILWIYKGLRGFSGIVISGIIGLDIFFLSFISCASMNPARSLAPALLSGSIGDLWLYWSATFIETSIVAFVLQRKFTT